jgi:hypothetical protein
MRHRKKQSNLTVAITRYITRYYPPEHMKGTHRERSVINFGMKRRFAILSTAACIVVFGAASGCGVQMGQEKIDEARQVQKQAEDSQRKLEKSCRRDKRTWKWTHKFALRQGAQGARVCKGAGSSSFSRSPSCIEGCCEHFGCRVIGSSRVQSFAVSLIRFTSPVQNDAL